MSYMRSKYKYIVIIYGCLAFACRLCNTRDRVWKGKGNCGDLIWMKIDEETLCCCVSVLENERGKKKENDQLVFYFL